MPASRPVAIEQEPQVMRPRIAFLMGDVGGVGPEMSAKLLSDPAIRSAADIVLIADPVVLAEGERIAGVSLPVDRVHSLGSLQPVEGRLSWLVDECLNGQVPPCGQSSIEAGAAALRSLRLATDAARSGHVQGIVFAPLNKHSLRIAGMAHEDELRMMAEGFGVTGFVCEFNITGKLWTSRVTSHVPLRDVAALITIESISDAVHIIQHALIRAGIAAPRIAVTGLNPHAGDGGSIGMEEIEIIEPAVRALRAQGLDVRGPMSPDTVFVNARRGDFDAVVSMYHDQGQIAMKLMGFEKGVTLHGGLPVPVTTPASGSAFDIAGKGIARIDGLREAFLLNTAMAASTLANKAAA
jgi:4-hydroxythreonine-4-phosphate dehydrogenase